MPAAVALIRLLAWEPSYAVNAVLKSKGKKKRISKSIPKTIDEIIIITELPSSAYNIGNL